jgi:hypothetical protein
MKVSRRCTGVVAAFGLIAAWAAVGVPAGATARASTTPTTRALLYLRSQQGASGAIAGPSGSYADSELYAIGAAAGGYDPKSLAASSGNSVMDYLAAGAAKACTTSNPGGCGELIQAVVAAGDAPQSFGGEDLLTTLSAAYDPTTGEYGDGEAFTQALAIQGLAAAGAQVPPSAVQFLVATQDGDGGWDYEDVANDPKAATDFDTSDTNSTSMVLMALDAAGDHTRDASALAWLATQQDADGGFPYQSGDGSDPDSTALVVQAIIATGADPSGAAWSKGDRTPLDLLVSTQDKDGGYTFPGKSGPDAFTTSQVPPALEGVAFPVPFASRRWYEPGAALSANATAGTSGGSPPAALIYALVALAAVLVIGGGGLAVVRTRR